MKLKYCPYLDGDSPQVNHYFHQENEKLRAICLAQEAEIARLQSGFDELLEIIENWETMTEYGLMVSCGVMASNIKRIAGVKK